MLLSSQQSRLGASKRRAVTLGVMTLVAMVACGVSAQPREKTDAMIERAETLVNGGRPAEAVTLLQVYVREQPGDSRGYVLLGRAYADMSQLDNAAKSLRRAIELSPRSLAAHLDLGVVEVMRDNREGGKKEFRRALAIDPNQREALYNLGRLMFDEKDYVSASHYFGKCVDLSPSDRDALAYSLRCAIARNERAQVTEIHRKLLRLLPQEAEPHLEVGLWLAKGNFYDDAEQEFETALALSPDSSAVRLDYAALCLDRGLPQRALDLLSPLSSSEDRRAPYHYLLGQCYEHLRNAQKALMEYKRAMEIDPGQETYYISLAALLASHEDKDAAATILSTAARRFPTSVRVRVGIGLIQLETGNVENAKAAYHEAVELAPHSPLCLNLLGRIQMAQGHYEEAVRTFNEVVRLAPSDAQGYLLMGLGYMKLPDRSGEALRAFLHALSLNPDMADNYYWVGSVYFYHEKRYAEAAKYVEQAIKRAPQWGAAYQLLIQSYRMMGDEAKAADAARRFREIGRMERPQLDLSILLKNQ
jgi:tetratricopeptide (TPR) repeat protein